jgi:hypothetical protein
MKPLLLIPALLLLSLTGCVERKITIASQPSGALVYLNDVEVGRTPVSVPFEWYGKYDVRLRLDQDQGGAAPMHYYLHTARRASAPFYEYMPIDLFAEVLPLDLKDEKVWAFILQPQPTLSDEEMISRAKELKQQLDAPVPLKPKDAKK